MPMRKRNALVTAAVCGAALTIALPGVAYASTTATVATPGTTSWSNPGSGALLKTDAHCTIGLVSGGGVSVTGSGTQQQIDGVHVMETEPSTDGTNPAGNGATDPAYWLGYGATGGQGGGNYTVQPFAVCFTNATVNHTQVVVSSVSGPTSSGGMTSTTATCPANTRLLGGGGQSKLASNLSVKLIASYPSNSSGSAAAGGTTNPTSWTAVALNGGMSGTGNTTTAYAVCSGSGINVSGITVTVEHTHVSGPNAASSTATATSSTCGTAGTMISGGASVSGGDPTTGTFTAPGSQGDHLDGDYPSNSSGTPASNGSATANWTAIGHAGGMSSTSNGTDAWGLCMN
jgi:hypothetical protein